MRECWDQVINLDEEVACLKMFLAVIEEATVSSNKQFMYTGTTDNGTTGGHTASNMWSPTSHN